MPGHWHYTPVLAYRYLGDAQTYPADPKSQGYKLVSPAVSLICVSWRARSLFSTTMWPWLLNPYLHQDRGGSRLGYVCRP